MKKAIFHAIDTQRISEFIERNHPGIMAKVELVKITQDWEDPSALFLEEPLKKAALRGREGKRDGEDS